MVTLPDIINERNLLSACSRVMQNEGAPGIDGMRTEELFAWLVHHWKELQAKVVDGSYRPEAVRRVEIPKPNGGVRQLGIPTVIDRMLQQSIAQELDKHYDSTDRRMDAGTVTNVYLETMETDTHADSGTAKTWGKQTQSV